MNSESEFRRKYEAMGIRFTELPQEPATDIGVLAIGVLAAVRNRLTQWADYYNYQSVSTLAPASTVAARLADEIFRAREPLKGINTPDPELDLRVPDEVILDAYKRMRAGERLYFV